MAMSSQSTACAPATGCSASGLPLVVKAKILGVSPESLCAHSTRRCVRETARPDNSVAAGAATWPVTVTRSRPQSAGRAGARARRFAVAVTGWPAELAVSPSKVPPGPQPAVASALAASAAETDRRFIQREASVLSWDRRPARAGPDARLDAMRDHVQGKRIMLTGGSGFLGARVRERLEAAGAAEVTVVRRQDFDLTMPAAVADAYDAAAPDTVVHLAAEVGGIGANRANPGRYFYANMAMGLHLIEEGRKRDIEKFVQVGTVCSYPKVTPVPFSEDELWNGYPEETNAPYGIAKKSLLVMLQAYREQYGLNGIYLMPVNLYGPNDNFDPATSHVIPALIRKCEEARVAGASEVVCWGTGSASREFLYVEDCAEAIVAATRRFDGPEPVNVGSNSEISIRELTELIA